MSSIVAFGAALIVSILCLPFSVNQVARLIAALPTLKNADAESADVKNSEVYIAQSLEVAYGFPASVLTLVAFGDLFEWGAIAGPVVLLVGVVVSVVFVGLRSLEHETTRLFLLLRVRSVSLVSAIIILANFAGLGIAIWHFAQASETGIQTH